MSGAAPAHRPMRAALLGFNDRIRNTLLMYFAGKGKDICEIVSERDCEIGIIDFDSLEGKQAWPDFRNRRPRPALLLSVSDQDFPDALWVRKPLDFDTLAEALKRLRRLPAIAAAADRRRAPADGGTSEARSPIAAIDETLPKACAASTPPTPAPHPVEATAPASPIAQIAQVATTAPIIRPEGTATPLESPDQRAPYYERDLRAYYGDRADEAYRDPARHGELYYDPDNYIQGALVRAWRKTVETGRPHGVTGLGKPLTVLSDRELLMTGMRDSYLRGLCIQSSRTVQTTIVPVVQGHDVASRHGDATRRLDDALWKVALWTSRGRVPVGTELDRPVMLRGWPNFTRICNPPHALQVVATWSRTPITLLQTAELLGVPCRAVFALYSACQVLGLIDSQATTVEPASVSLGTPPPPPPKRRALLSALLRKLG